MRSVISKQTTMLKNWVIARMPRRKKRAALTKEARQFAGVGAIATTIDVVLLNVLVGFAGLPAIVANLMSVTVSTSFSYVLNRRVTFSHGDTRKRRTIVPYIIVTAIGMYGLQSLVIWLVTTYASQAGEAVAALSQMLVGASFPPELILLNIAKILAIVVASIWNFILYRRVVFKAHRSGPQ